MTRVLVECQGESLTQTIVLPVEIPEGWRRVFSGAVKPRDRYLEMEKIRDGQTEWLDIDLDVDYPLLAEYYGCLIRHEPGVVELPCERCQTAPRRFGERFCHLCRKKILRRD